MTWLSFISAFPTVLAPSSLSRTQLCVFSINFFASQIKSTTWIPAFLTLHNTTCSNSDGLYLLCSSIMKELAIFLILNRQKVIPFRGSIFENGHWHNSTGRSYTHKTLFHSQKLLQMLTSTYKTSRMLNSADEAHKYQQHTLLLIRHRSEQMKINSSQSGYQLLGLLLFSNYEFV